MTRFPSYHLSLADGTHLTLVGVDDHAAALLALFTRAAKIEQGNGSGQHVIISTDDANMFVETVDGSVFRYKLAHNGMVNLICLYGLSHVIARQTNGGILLHGALMEHENRGVLLIAKGGTGKTTASNRLPSDWRSLSDDLTLVVRDTRGKYWAHPWPTWSRFINKVDAGSDWDVQKAVPLHAIFQLSQAHTDWAEPLDRKQSILFLLQSVEQIFLARKNALDVNTTRQLRLQRFDRLCALTQDIPLGKLNLSLYGPFWRILEDALEKRIKITNG